MEDGYDFEYESDGGPWGPEEEGSILIENLYYEAQDCLQSKPEKAVALIEEVLQREAEAPQKPWSFKSLLSLTLLFLREGDFLRAAADYQRLLQLLPAVAASDAAAAVQAVLSAATKRAGIRQYDGLPDVFAASSQQKHHQQQRADAHLCRRQPNTEDLQPLSEGEGNTKTPCLQQGEQQLEELMLSTIAALESQGLNRLWAHVCSQLLLLYVKLGELQKVLVSSSHIRDRQLAGTAAAVSASAASSTAGVTAACATWSPEGMRAQGLLPSVHGAGRDPSLPLHQQLEAAAAEVLCYTYTQDWKQLQQLLPHALQLAAASLDPRSAAAVRECGARLLLEMHVHPELELQQEQGQQQEEEQQQQPWVGIHAHLMAAFRHYQEVGDTRAAAAALRRAVLAAPLAASSVDPFSTREGKALQGDPEVQCAKALRAAFEANDVEGVDKHLKLLGKNDPFAVHCSKALLLAVRLRRLKAISCCYSVFPLRRLQQTLRLSEEGTRQLLLQVIQQGQLPALIDDEANMLRLRQPEEEEAACVAELLDQWCCNVGQLAACLAESFPEELQGFSSKN